jgi:GntR family transcriptional regulator / MocR family aminotransferase
MQGTWSTSVGLDLYLELSGTRPRAALEGALRDAVRSGRLAPGTALPSSRSLALDLGIARNTVADAYGQLVAEGWLAARHGSGTWVAERAEALPSRALLQARPAGRGARYDLRPGAPDLALFPRPAWLASARRALTAAPARDLGYADARGLEVLRIAIAEYVARARGVITTPDRIVVCAGFAQGLELLCETLRASGVRTLAVEAYGHSGHRQIAASAGLRLLSLPVDDRGADIAALASPLPATGGPRPAATPSAAAPRAPAVGAPAVRPPGRKVAARGSEATGGPEAGDGREAGGGRVAAGGREVTDGRVAAGGGEATGGRMAAGGREATGGGEATGGRMAAGGGEATGGRMAADGREATGGREAAGGRAGAALLTPAHQFPLGVALAPARRRQAADWAAQTGGLVIEDDYDGEFRYDRQAVGALQSLAPDHVVYAGTASKSLVPGLRLGWLALPGEIAAEVVARKQAAARLSSSLDQLALAEFISSGGYDRQVRRARLAYRQRRDRLVAALAREVPGVQITGIAAGLHVLVRLPAGVAEDDIVARGAARGLALRGLASCRAGDQVLDPALIVGYATPPGHAFSAAVARLCAVLCEAMPDS